MAIRKSRNKPSYTRGGIPRRDRRPRSARAAGGIGAPPRGRPRPAPVIIIACVIAALVLCWVFGRGCGGSRQARENEKIQKYTNAVNSQVDRSAALASQFNNIRGALSGLSQDEVDMKFKKIQDDCEKIASEVRKLDVPSKAAGFQPLLQLTFDLRTSGVEQYRAGMTGVIEAADIAAAERELSDAMRKLATSDTVFANYSAGLGTVLKKAKLTYVELSSAGEFVPNIDDASIAGIEAYLASQSFGTAGVALSTSPERETAAEKNDPVDAMDEWFKENGVTIGNIQYSVVSESASSDAWKLDKAVRSDGTTGYFLLQRVGGTWKVVKYKSEFTKSELKELGAPGDLKAP